MSEARANGVFIIAAPSGAGKTSLVAALLQRAEQLTLSISHTTRPPRPGERDGEHYHFVTPELYRGMVSRGEFLEHATVHGHGYGTARAGVVGQLDRGLDVVCEIDWQGARQIKALMPESVGIFILPPSRAALAQRLRRRAQDSEAVIARRLDAAVVEMGHYHEFDYLVINDAFETALDDLISVVRAERLGTGRQSRRHRELVAELLGEDALHSHAR